MSEMTPVCPCGNCTYNPISAEMAGCQTHGHDVCFALKDYWRELEIEAQSAEDDDEH